MASLYRRKDSSFWWVQYLDVAGVRRCKSTGFRVDVPADAKRALDLRRELEVAERADARSRGSGRGKEYWEAWVPRFLQQRYSSTPKTFERYSNSWRRLASFLAYREIFTPRQLDRQAVRDFVEWRMHRHAEIGVYEVGKNTALHEIKVLRIIMGEAVASGFATVNPCNRLDIKADRPLRKPRITSAEHTKILKLLLKEPEWMRVSYLIAWHQGCRFSETCVDLADVDLERKVIGLRTKGHKESLAEFPLAPELVALFEDLKKRGRSNTFDMPAMPGKAWWLFFRRNKLSHLCFHCTRVTFITRCYEAGIPRDSVMRLCGHSSYAAHEIYPRLSADHS